MGLIGEISMLLLVIVVVFCSQGAMALPTPLDPTGGGCQPNRLNVYKVVMQTYWTRSQFPKHYPDWRPPAQWSKLLGRSHDGSFVLFRLGTRASSGVKLFAETGSADLLEQRGQGDGGVMDEFLAPAVSAGGGRTEATFFVDGNHSRVSLMSKIVPSPDWFVGIDSFNLCVDGSWLDTITIEVDPLDAGTDNGFTFTAPNWPTDPQGVVYKVTSRYPSHPAGSFYYPYMKRLPPIATFQFIKLKEYELSEVFHRSEDERHYDVINMDDLGPRRANLDNNEIQTQIEEERREQEMALLAQQQHKTTTTIVPLTPTTSHSLAPTPSSPLRDLLLPGGNKDAILNSIVQTYKGAKDQSPRKKYHGKFRKNMRKIRPPRDCRVSEWSPWSTCSKSCGIGEMQRQRQVLKHARRGGKVCPPLVENKWCGSARTCSQHYFDWKK